MPGWRGNVADDSPSFLRRPVGLSPARLDRSILVPSRWLHAMGAEAARAHVTRRTGTPSVGRFIAVIELDDREARDRVPQGASGTVAVYTRSGKPVHIISRVVMRMHA